ncbi:hypothetical protein CIY_21480 [Butyrivibrio fibrisolvens 16/4]|nr:hypothetical protein CIY_21480 [Butyrivibrio fibrisolvens 16/4]
MIYKMFASSRKGLLAFFMVEFATFLVRKLEFEN